MACSSTNAAPYNIFFAELSPASTHDIEILKRTITQFNTSTIYADKAYRSNSLIQQAKELDISLVTPFKKPKNRKQDLAELLLNSVISSTRQTIETAFNWVQRRTGILQASHVRSSRGLIRHVYTALLGLSLGMV